MFQPINPAASRHRAVVVELVIAITIQHTVDLKDIGVGVCAGELITCTIKAKNKLLAKMTSRLYRSCVLHSIVLRARNNAQRENLGESLFCFLWRYVVELAKQWKEKQIVVGNMTHIA
jgi:hypothetical protein